VVENVDNFLSALFGYLVSRCYETVTAERAVENPENTFRKTFANFSCFLPTCFPYKKEAQKQGKLAKVFSNLSPKFSTAFAWFSTIPRSFPFLSLHAEGKNTLPALFRKEKAWNGQEANMKKERRENHEKIKCARFTSNAFPTY